MRNPITSSFEKSEEYLPVVQDTLREISQGTDAWIDETTGDILVGTMAFEEDRSFDDVLVRIKTNGQILQGESVEPSIRKSAQSLMKKIHKDLAAYVTKKPNPKLKVRNPSDSISEIKNKIKRLNHFFGFKKANPKKSKLGYTDKSLFNSDMINDYIILSIIKASGTSGTPYTVILKSLIKILSGDKDYSDKSKENITTFLNTKLTQTFNKWEEAGLEFVYKRTAPKENILYSALGRAVTRDNMVYVIEEAGDQYLSSIKDIIESVLNRTDKVKNKQSILDLLTADREEVVEVTQAETVEEIPQQIPKTPEVKAIVEEVIKKKRGRPKGSKNKPKESQQQSSPLESLIERKESVKEVIKPVDEQTKRETSAAKNKYAYITFKSEIAVRLKTKVQPYFDKIIQNHTGLAINTLESLNRILFYMTSNPTDRHHDAVTKRVNDAYVLMGGSNKKAREEVWLQKSIELVQEAVDKGIIASEREDRSNEFREYEAEYKNRLRLYAEEYKKIPVYNEIQWLAKECVIQYALGYARLVYEHLETLIGLCEEKNIYETACNDFSVDSTGNLIVYKPMLQRRNPSRKKHNPYGKCNCYTCSRKKEQNDNGDISIENLERLIEESRRIIKNLELDLGSARENRDSYNDLWNDRGDERDYHKAGKWDEKVQEYYSNIEEEKDRLKDFLERLKSKKSNPVPAGVDAEEFDSLVKKLKKRKDVDNPYALANWILTHEK